MTQISPYKKIAIVFRYTRANIYSYHALAGALEINEELCDIPIFVPKSDIFFEKINHLIANEKYDLLIIGLSINSFQIDDYKQVFKQLSESKIRNKLKIIVGGPHPSAKPAELLDLGADFVVIGEGEESFPSLVKKIIENESTENLAGIAYKTNKIQINPQTSCINLDDYPPFGPKYGLYSALEITRGCNFNCKYCQVPTLFGKPVRYRSPQNVIKWGKYLLTRRDSWDFRFISPNAFGYGSKISSKPNVEMIKELLTGLRALKAKKRQRIYFGTFPSEVRPESVTEDTLDLTREYCDNDNLTMGAQTGSPKILKLIHRGHTVEQVIDAVDLAKTFSFVMNVDIILGYPEETTKDQYLTIDFCKELIDKGCKIHMHYLIPLPGTKYENITPSEIDSEVLKIIRRWSNDGLIFGSWQHQFQKVRNQIK
ncbi:MAG: TIGR04013 family B12-binding domain/radical SAM domain-containing protein [Asgard group archaeon]|nr:TIGR04013 family B12-binding domain/radical SAM domain-containing protein [Asgard group archaeon]